MAREAIFIGYRRDDTADVSGRIYDAMEQRFGRGRVFKDVDNLRPGSDFGAYIRTILPQCRVVLVLMGPHWLEAADATGRRRLDDPNDWVRIEIETALATPGVDVVPVLVNGARMPRGEELPESLHGLLRLHAAVIRRDPDFRDDVTRLANALRATVKTGVLTFDAFTNPATRSAEASERDGSRRNFLGAGVGVVGAAAAIGVGAWQWPRISEMMSRAPEAEEQLPAGLPEDFVATTVNTPSRVLDLAQGELTRFALSPDGSQLLVPTAAGPVLLVDLATGETLHTLRGHTTGGWAPHVAFSSDGAQALTAASGSARLWRLQNGEQLRVFEGEHPAIFHPDGESVVLGWRSLRMRSHDIATGQVLATYANDFGATFGAACSPDGRQVLVSSIGSARIYDAVSGALLHRISDDKFGYAASYSPDGASAVVGTAMGAAMIDPSAGQQIRTFDIDGAQILNAAFSPNGRYVLAVSWGQKAAIWEAATGRLLQTFVDPGGLFAGLFTPDGRTVITSSNDGALRFWDVDEALLY